MNWIENICEPRRLFLAWQAPDHAGDRFRWAVGEVVLNSTSTMQLHYFSAEEFGEYNQGRTLRDIEHLGYRGYPGFRTKQTHHTDGVAEALLRRLPPRSRSDFQEYRKHFRLNSALAISDFALLAYTEAKLPNDGFSLVNPLDSAKAPFDLLLEAAGSRYYREAAVNSKIGQPVSFAPEAENKFDARAVMICANNSKIGYVNRLQAEAFHHWIAHAKLTGVIERINGTSERPRIFVFVRVREGNRVAA